LTNEKAGQRNWHHSPIRPSLKCVFGYAVYPHLHVPIWPVSRLNAAFTCRSFYEKSIISIKFI
jgi:hypothetical protein